jgi:hypothetical protein
MITKYVTGGFGKHPIEQVEVERETTASVWINGSRNAKVSDWKNYFDTWDEAKQYLLNQAEAKLTGARFRLQSARSEHGNIKGLKNPF